MSATGSDNQIVRRYQNASKLQDAVGNIGKAVLNATVLPHWINDHCFWYRRETQTGNQFRLVDVIAGTNDPAFHHENLAVALAKATGQCVSGKRLPLTRVVISLKPKQVTFIAFNQTWCLSEDETLKVLEQDPSPSKYINISPDGKKGVFIRDYNLWIRDLASGEEAALTADGKEFFEYGCASRAWGIYPNFYGVQARWSPDSRQLFTYQVDNRQVKSTPVVYHLPRDGSLRPTLKQPRVALKGDKYVETNRLIAIDVTRGKIQAADYHQVPSTRSAHGLFTDGLAWWGKDSCLTYFIDIERGSKTAKVVEFDAQTGATRILFEETSDTVVRLSFDKMDDVALWPLPESGELIWFSERSGWAHLYLYDLFTGELKHPITQGRWLVRELLHFDADRRELWFQAGGRTDGYDPYYLDICRVNIDSGDIETVVSGDTNYAVLAERSSDYFASYKLEIPDPMLNGSGVSPHADYVVSTRSRVDTLPVSLLLDREGNQLLEIEVAEVMCLPDNWQWPEPVALTAADGKTDIYGVVFRPSDFTSKKQYPVIDCSKCNPELAAVPKAGFEVFGNGTDILQAAALAELGFITVIIDGRGTINRDKAFVDASHGWYPNCNLIEDRITGIQQLAERFPYMDINRVGVMGFHSSQSAVIAMLTHPEFFKVGVSHGITDARIGSTLNSEHFDGTASYKAEDKPVEKLAANLQGKLFLLHGMNNAMTPPAGTFRLIEALQKANKDFDLLLLPNEGISDEGGGHIDSKYAMRRTWDYFVRHLLGVTPPKEYEL